VVLVEVDHVGVERAQRGLAGGAQVLAAAVELPRLAAPRVPALGGHQHAVAAPVQGPGDQPLVVADVVLVPRVRVGGVDQVHARVDRRVDRAHGALLRRAGGERHRHRTEADREHVGAAKLSGHESSNRTVAGSMSSRSP
jgi:hypothetical protein